MRNYHVASVEVAINCQSQYLSRYSLFNGKIYIFQVIRIVRQITGHFMFLVSIFNWQILINFCNPPLKFIDIDTRDILGQKYL